MVSQGSRATDPQQDKIRDRNQNGKGNDILVIFAHKKNVQVSPYGNDTLIY